MSQSDKAYELLKELREFAEKREIYHCELAIKGLITYLKPQPVMEIAFNELEKFLPKFEKYHPNLVWFRQWHEQAKLFKPLDYQASNFEFWGESEDYNYEKSPKGWIASALQDAIRHLDWAYKVYLSGEITVVFWGYLGNFFTILSSAYHGIYVIENCPQAYLDQKTITETLRDTEFEHLGLEEQLKIRRIHQAWRTCVESEPYDYWFDLADHIEKHLQRQAV